MTMDPVSHVEDVHKQHASIQTYLRVAAILTVVTIVELMIPYVPKSVLPEWLGISLLAMFSIAKFAIVVMFFMHLYYDSHLMAFLFCIGLALATGTILSTKALMNAHSLEKPAPIAAKAAEKLLPPDPKRGEAAIQTKACVTCHTIQALPTMRGTVGPALDGIADRAATRRPGMTAQAYIEEHITNPRAFTVPGYPPTMPSDIRDTLTDQEYVDIVAYLMTLKGK